MVPIILFCNISFKVCNNACIIFVLKYVTLLRIKPSMAKPSASGGWRRLYFCNFFKSYSWTNLFYGSVLSRHTIMIDPNTKPIILGYSEEVDTDSRMKARRKKVHIIQIVLHVVYWLSILVKSIETRFCRQF